MTDFSHVPTRQDAMFAVIARQPGRPTKDAVIAQIRAMDQGGVA